MSSSPTSSDPFHVLCIEPGATDQQVKTAYRTMAKKYHPDLNKDPDSPRKFRIVQEAYQRIVDGYTPSNNTGPADRPYKIYEFVNGHALEALVIRSETTLPAGTIVHISKGNNMFKFRLEERKRLPFDVTVRGLRLKFRNPPEGFDSRY